MPLAHAAILALVLFLAAVLPDRPAAAVDDAGNFVSVGLGGQSCRTYAAVLRQPTRAANRTNALLFQAWVAGHITGLNSWVTGTSDFLAPLTLADAMRALTRFCRNNPRASLDDAIINLEYGLIGKHRTRDSQQPAL